MGSGQHYGASTGCLSSPHPLCQTSAGQTIKALMNILQGSSSKTPSVRIHGDLRGLRGSSGSSSDQQDVQLVTSGQGIRESCAHSLPPATRPTGKPSLPVTWLPTAEQSKKFISLRLSSVNVPLPWVGDICLMLIIKEADVEKSHSPLLLFQFHGCCPLENSTWLIHSS